MVESGKLGMESANLNSAAAQRCLINHGVVYGSDAQ